MRQMRPMGLFAVPYWHRRADMGRDLWRLPSQSPLLRGKVYICSRENGASRHSLTFTEQIKTDSGKPPFERTSESTGGQITCEHFIFFPGNPLMGTDGKSIQGYMVLQLNPYILYFVFT